MKKYLLAAVLSFGILASPVFTQAASLSDTQVQSILSLLSAFGADSAIIANVNIALKGGTPSPAPSPVPTPPVKIVQPEIPNYSVCSILYRNLSQGVQGDDVRGLQEFLNTEGYLSNSATGYFGPMTAGAVAKWQASQGVQSVGSVGPMTRERIKVWCGEKARFAAEPHSGSAPLTVKFKALVGGFNPYRYAIDFGDGKTPEEVRCSAPADVCEGPAVATHTYSADGAYTAVLYQFGSNGSVNDSTRLALAKQQIYVGQVACTKDYKPVCGSKQIVCITTPCNPIPQTYGNACMMKADGATFLYEGQCKTDVVCTADAMMCPDGSSVGRTGPNCEFRCAPQKCTPRPSCLDSTPRCLPAEPIGGWCPVGNMPPIISGFSGPTTLPLNVSGTWKIGASDPENQQLSYRVIWGDEVSMTQGTPTAMMMDTFVQSTTFTHAYAKAGVYTVIIVVRDNSGQEAKTSATVKVGSDGIACTREYMPVCGQPKWSCPAGMMCATVMPAPRTYSNRCSMDAEGATFLREGECQSGQF